MVHIRNDDGYWNELEEYFTSQNLGVVTHGICRDWLEKEKNRNQ
jgi:hypothetical protein